MTRSEERVRASTSDERSHHGLLLLLVVALLLRALLSLADALGIIAGGDGLMRIAGVVDVDTSPVWPLVWGVVAFASALLLWRRRILGWGLVVVTCVASLVVGTVHAVAVVTATAGPSVALWVVFLADVVVPTMVLAGLITIRPWFLGETRRARAAPAEDRRA